MNENNNKVVRLEEEVFVFDFRQFWQLCLSNWYWILGSMVACVLIAGICLWFASSTVTVTGKMEIIDKSKKGSAMSAGLAMLNSLPMGLGSSLGGAVAGSIDSEKEIILSNSLVTNVVKGLGLYTEYRLSKWGRKTLLYQNNPVEVSLDKAHVAWLDTELPLYFHQIKLTISKDDEGYTVEPTLVENKEETDLPEQTFATLPATIKTEAGTLTIKENKLPARLAKPYEGSYTLKVTITPPVTVANDFIKRTSFEKPNKKVSNMANISLNDENVLRGIDYVNALVGAYNQRANDEKNEEALKTEEFVNTRLAKIDAELGSSDAAWENSKKNFQITTPEVDAQEALTKKSEYEAKLVAIGTELQLHDYLCEYVNNPANFYEIIPAGISSSAAMGSGTGSGASSGGSAGTASLLAQHNTLVNQRRELLKSVSEMSPQLQRVNQSIKELQPVIQTALKRDRQSILMRQNTLQREYGKSMGRIGSAPKVERVLTEIGREREIKQAVFLLMLQKREETAMELANITDKGKLIDPPAPEPGSNKPKMKMVLLVALFLGALLPVGFLYLFQMFKVKIDTRQELESATKLPILAELSLATVEEAIRTLRTNLLLNIKDGQKVLLVASANKGDGKTSIAKRLEESLNAIGKKALLINGDLRNNASSMKAHPSDILAGEAFSKEVAEAKSANDFVILDSPALGEYNDALQLASYADATLYIVKVGKTQKSDVKSLTSNKNIPTPFIVLNK